MIYTLKVWTFPEFAGEIVETGGAEGYILGRKGLSC